MPQFPGAGTGASLVSLPVVGTGYTESGPGWSWDPGSSQVDITGDGPRSAATGSRRPARQGQRRHRLRVQLHRHRHRAALPGHDHQQLRHHHLRRRRHRGHPAAERVTGHHHPGLHHLRRGLLRQPGGLRHRGGHSRPATAYRRLRHLLDESRDRPPHGRGVHDPGLLFLHDPGFYPGDHSEPVYCGNGTATGLISGNAILSQLSQTAAVFIANAEGVTANITVEGNLLAGGGYAVYGGGGSSQYGPATGITVSGNYFSTMYWPQGGYYGPVADWSAAGNTWSGNTWHDGPDAGQPVAA